MPVAFIAALAAATSLASSRPANRDQTLAGPQLSFRGGDSLRANVSATAIRARPQAPRLDGRLDDAAWAQAPAMSDFVQRDPDEGRPASERTDVRVLYTDDAIYIGVRAFDSNPGGIAAQLTRRDEDSPSDWIFVAIDSYHDRRTAFLFAVNPAGVKRDLYAFNDVEEDDSWDAVWDVSVSSDAEGWSAEFRIPWSQLRFAAADNHTFGFNVARKINRKNELSYWRLIPRNANGRVSLYGELQGIEGIRPPRRLEVLPYSAARMERGRPSPLNPFDDGRTQGGTAGADIKYGLTSNLTLDVTINPDFGQVDADPAFVNLSAFEQFLPERRPFFTEGVNIFRFGIALGDGDGANEQLFYSRRVGRAPQGYADPRGGYAEEIPNTTILGAAKLSGRTPGGWSIGLLGAVTAEEEANVIDSAGATFQDVVEPRSTYVVGRLSRDFREGRSVVGFFGTALHRSLPSNLEILRSDAFSGGLDWNHRFAGGGYRFRGWVVGSHVRGSEAAITRTQRSSARYFQRPDNDHRDVDSTATALTGFAAQMTVGKENGNWRWSTGVDTRSPEFEVNDMGFMREADYAQQFVWVSRRWLTPGRVFRRLQVNLNQWSAWNYGGERLFTGGNVNINGQFANYWNFGTGINRGLSGINLAELRGGPGLRRPGNWNGWAFFGTDHRKPVRFGANPWFFAQDENDSRGFGLWTELAWRPSGRINISAEPFLERVHDDWKYFSTETVAGQTEYVMSELTQHTFGMGIRANVTFTPTLTLQLYAQPFYATGQHGGFKHVTDPRSGRYADRFAASPSTRDSLGDVTIDVDGDGSTDLAPGNPDFSYTSFRSNLVLRWEYRPGSTIFVVWQQGREVGGSNAQFRPEDVYRSIRDARPENVFLVKVNYWLSL